MEEVSLFDRQRRALLTFAEEADMTNAAIMDIKDVWDAYIELMEIRRRQIINWHGTRS